MQIPRMYSRFETIHNLKIPKLRNVVPKIWKYLKKYKYEKQFSNSPKLENIELMPR
jgi:hypothetical protein